MENTRLCLICDGPIVSREDGFCCDQHADEYDYEAFQFGASQLHDNGGEETRVPDLVTCQVCQGSCYKDGEKCLGCWGTGLVSEGEPESIVN